MRNTAQQIAALEAEIEDNYGRPGNAERRQRLEELKEKQRTIQNHRRVMKARLNSANHRDARDEYHVRRVMGQIAFAAGAKYDRDGYGALRIIADFTDERTYYSNPAAIIASYPTHPAFVQFRPYLQATEIMQRAIDNGLLTEAQAEFDRKGRGKAINHSIYGFTGDGAVVLVQERTFERDKRYSNLRLDYVLTDGETAVWIQNGVKSLIKRAATSDPAPDSPLRAIRKHLPADWQDHISPEPVRISIGPREGYKLVEALDDGTLVSLWDGKTTWATGQTKAEKLLPDHAGGLYYYTEPEKAMTLVRANWGRAVKRFALLHVRIEGAVRRYGDKRATSQMTPLAVLRYEHH